MKKRVSVSGAWRKEPLIWTLLGGLLIGIVFVNLKRNLFVNEIDFLGTDVLYEMKYMSLDYGTFFWEVLKKRIIPIICIMVLATTYLGVVASYAYAGWLGASVGMFLGTAIIRYGVKGLFLCFVTMFPHYLIYLPAWLLLLKGARELCSCIYFPGGCRGTYINGRKDEIRFGLKVLLKVLGVVIIGIIVESYVNPKLLLSFLKIF